jgi:hypothetical protein
MQLEGGLIYSRLLNSKLDNGTNLGFINVPYLFKKSDVQIMLGLKYEVFDNVWLSGRLLYSVISTNALGINQINYGLLGSPSRGGFYNNLLQFTLSFHLFGSKSDDISSPAAKSF